MNIKHIIILVVGLLMISFVPTDSVTSNKLSVLIVKLRYNSHGITGFGGSLKVRNLETNEVYESKSKKGFGPYVIVENIPVGNYKVEDLKIISGPNVLTLGNELEFNRIKIDTSQVYYLGSYLTKKIPPIKDLNFQMIRTENDEKETIYKQLKKKSDNWQKLQIDFQQTILLNDTTTIKIKKYR
ncbi:MAG TPA: hypothetical protein VK212_08130 [Lentimicrobium sp.]|nr:hypothetical protein [Lentimicrobium sp.]